MKILFATIALASLSSLAVAAPSEFEIPAGTLSRAEVRAAATGQMIGEATEFALPKMSALSRADVLAELQADRAERIGYGESSTLRFERDAWRAAHANDGQLAHDRRMARRMP